MGNVCDASALDILLHVIHSFLPWGLEASGQGSKCEDTSGGPLPNPNPSPSAYALPGSDLAGPWGQKLIHPWWAQKCSSPGTVGLEENKSKHVSGRKVYCLRAFSIPRAHSITTGLWKDPRFAEMLVSTMCVTEKRQFYRDCPARIASPGCEPACGKGATWQASV